MATNEGLTSTATSMEPPIMRPCRSPNARMIQNFHLVWLDGSIDEVNNDDCRNSIIKLQQVVNTVNTFTDVDECIDFITDIKDTMTFMIISEAFSSSILPVVQTIAQVSSVYILCENKALYEKWMQQWSKLKGVHTNITSICEALQQTAHDCDQNSVSISFVKAIDGASKENQDQLDQSFMYTQILKEILLTIDFEQEHINEFLAYCRKQFVNNTTQLKNVDKIQTEYYRHQPIWWYTYDCFLYSMLNRVLRTMEVDLIIKMGFFVRDLHNHIAELHTEQYGGRHHSYSFTVYRGQGLSQTDFDQLKKTQGGLLSFNNFLSTSLDRQVSLAFAESNQYNPDLVGILFEITINSSKSSSPFANVKNVSYYHGEEEILFSMHSIFRIGQVKQINGNNRLWQVDLILTNENDPQLHALTEHMRKELKGSTGWLRLGELMIKLGQFNKAEELYEILLEKTANEGKKADLYHMLGMVKLAQGELAEACRFFIESITIKGEPLNQPLLVTSYSSIGGTHNHMAEHSRSLSSYEKALEICQNTLPANHPDFAICYNNIGSVYDEMGEYSKALSFYEKALEIKKITLPTNHFSLATTYSNIGSVYESMGEHSKALSYCEKVHEIFQKTLPPNHPSLATSYNNIGTVYESMGEHSKALSFYEKALEILQQTHPPNHPNWADSYNNMAIVYDKMGEYSKALSFYEKALEIFRMTLPANHANLANSYNNIGGVYNNMGEYSKALLHHERALEIEQKTLPANHPHLITSYNRIGALYNSMGEYSKALPFYEKALEIEQKTLPSNHPDLANSYNNIGWVYRNTGDYSKALSYSEKALEIREKTLPLNYPDLGTSYNNIGSVYYNMGEYSKAHSFHEKALEIFQINLPANHASLANSYNNIGELYDNIGEYSKALSHHEKALEILEKTLPPNHPSLATSYNNIGWVYRNTGDYSKALSYSEKALEIREKTLPLNYPHLGTSYNNIGLVYYDMGVYTKALSYCEKALGIFQKSLPANHPSLATSYNNIATMYNKIGEYSKALPYFESALDIWEHSLPFDHPHLQTVRESIEVVKKKL